MNIQINLDSRNAKKLADFYAKAFDLNVEEIKCEKLDRLLYICKDTDGSGFTIEQSDHDTKDLSITVIVPRVSEKRKDLQNKGFRLDNLSTEESFFSFDDPQGNRIAILK